MEPTLKIEIKDIAAGQKYQVVGFFGEFDKAGHSDIKSRLDQLVENFAGDTLVFDVSALKFINSEGIGYLMEIHTHLVKQKKTLALVGPAANISDVFQAIGISEVIPVYSDMQSFLNTL